MIAPGTLIKIKQKSQPVILGALRKFENLGTVPDGSVGMVITGKGDRLYDALNFARSVGAGRHIPVVYYLVLWEGKNVWVSSNDASFEAVQR